MRRLLLGALLVACSTRRPQTAPPPGPPPIELRAARGELVAQLQPRGEAWQLRAGRDPALEVRVGARGAEVRGPDGATVAALRPGAAGFALLGRDGRTLRVTFDRPRGVAHVLDPLGVTIVAVDGAVARDAAARVAATASGAGDRLVVDGPDGARRATVHNLPTGADTPLAALLLADGGIDLAARAALVAYVLSR
jgi:hypothetical protein